MSLSEVLAFIDTASPSERIAIAAAAGAVSHNRNLRAAATLATINVGEMVKFLYNGVNYEGQVVKINQKTAKVRITNMDSAPTRRGVVVGATVGVGASILARR
jgi:hypothetical protein